jgi:hypothetical protein
MSKYAHPYAPPVTEAVPRERGNGTLRVRSEVRFNGLDNRTIFRKVTLHVDYCASEVGARADMATLRNLNEGTPLEGSYTVKL